ncbi:Peroxisomal targeting signal receptor [Smittium culicis]|uniref:Peroxisomal targeting signal receptor n=1 Tax=Smittium culicis TaxID=133412 RepID=A0A1R1XPL9_9FUNG|nr:Peroxisomal targeting signal receptor [Smittium culicis]
MSGGADCSKGNPLDSINKHFNKDSSLQQGRFGPAGSSHVPPQQAFRQAFNDPAVAAPINDKQLSKEFLDASIHKGPDPFAFSNFSRELQSIQGPVPNANPWANEFHARPNFNPIMQSELQNMNAAFNNASLTNQPIQAPINALNQPVNQSFNQQRFYNDRPAFMYNQQPMQYYNQQPMQFYNQVGSSIQNNDISTTINNDSSTQELNQDKLKDNEINMEDQNDLADIAKRILDSTRHSTNPKINDSDFFKLLHDLSNNTSSIQNLRAPEASATNMAENKVASENSWASEFATHTSNITQPQEVLNNGNIVSESEAVAIEKNWYEEFEKSLDGPLKESFVAGSMEDFDAELAKVEDQIKFDTSDLTDPSLSEDWIKEYKKSIESLMNETDNNWESQSKSWYENSAGYRANNPAFDSYKFFTDNPFSSMDRYQVESVINQVKADPSSKSLADTILALESALQNDPSNAQLWTLLGIKQQENEREDAAIAALRKAISIDPNLIEAHMAIAVSYTNENFYLDAYHSFYEWISRHGEYSKLTNPSHKDEDLKKIDDVQTRKNFVQGLFLDAARQRPGNDWDPDVQIALGVLFNISEEYNKAVDCFKASLSKRPDDYMTWNKLGATLANNKNPQKATDAYFNALEIHPSYIRARYNLAIASINMKQYNEAAEYLLGALSLQKKDMISDPTGANSGSTFVPAISMSTIIWDTLKTIMYALNEPSLAELTDGRDLDAFRTKFTF